MLFKLKMIIKKIIPKKWSYVLGHEGFKRYFRNTGWMFGGQTVSLFLSFFVGVWVARYLGPENYGALNYAIAFVGLFGFVAGLGIDNILSRELVKFPEKRDKILGTGFWIKFVSGFIAGILAIIVACFSETSPLIKVLIILFSCSFVFQSLNVVTFFFQSRVESKNSVIPQTIAALISVLLKIILIYFGVGVIWIIAVYALDSIWQGIGLIIVYKRSGRCLSAWKFDIAWGRWLLRDSWPLMFSSLAVFLYMKIDQVMIGKMLGNREVGLYAAASKLAEIWYFIPVIICGSLFPAIIQAEQRDKKIFEQRLRQLYYLMFFLAFGLAFVVSIFSRPIILLLFGAGYLPAVGVLKIYIWAGIGVFLGVASTQYLVTKNFSRSVLAVTVSAALLNIILNFYFIKMWGIEGAALATLAAYSLVPGLNILIQRRENRRSITL